MVNKLTFVTATGKDIEPYISDLGKLRISVFYDFPYLYEGDLAYEKQYLKVYSTHSQGFLFAVYDQKEMVGATTGIPLLFETSDIQAPFISHGIAIESVFYF
ncbi:MAG: GNAT family N-acetyltransferase, partial [Cytophagales bacterium]|nr:GNAT family N-acetyltransferase [Cytophagales bacterium]